MIRISISKLKREKKLEFMTDDIIDSLLFRLRYRDISGCSPFYEIEWDDDGDCGEQGISSFGLVEIVDELKVRFGDVMIVP
jgi:hypothetical protein